MKKTIFTTYTKKLVKFVEKELEVMLDEENVEIARRNNADIVISKDGNDYYDKVGYFGEYGSNKVFLTKYRTTDYEKFSPIKVILKAIHGEEFKTSFLDNLDEDGRKIYQKIDSNFTRQIIGGVMMGYNNSEKDWLNNLYDTLYLIINKRLIYSEKHLVAGVSVPIKEITIDICGVKVSFFRPTTKEYLTETDNNNLPHSRFSSWAEFKFFNRGSVIDRKVIFQGLRLYKLGSVFSLGALHENYEKYSNGRIKISDYYRDYKKYWISENDKKRLSIFFSIYYSSIQRIRKLEPKKKIKKDEILDYSLKVAIDRYNYVLLNPFNDQDKRVAFSIMGLEALYNLDSEKQNVAFKLKSRCAKILSFFEIDSILIASDISKAYDIRSKYAHGTITSKNITFDFEQKIMEYLRLSILFFLEVKLPKEDFVKLMNQAYYNDIANTSIKKVISEIALKLKNTVYSNA